MTDIIRQSDGGKREVSLPELLAKRARRASDGSLALDTGSGIVTATVVLLWHPVGWRLLLSAALCCAAYGVWGIADRQLAESEEREAGGAAAAVALGRVLRGVRASAVEVGVVSLAALAFNFLAAALGPIIS